MSRGVVMALLLSMYVGHVGGGVCMRGVVRPSLLAMSNKVLEILDCRHYDVRWRIAMKLR